MIADQSPEGVEVLRGSSTYTYDGNWKVQAENGADGYHVSAVHWNYAATTARRSTGESATETKAMDAGQWGKLRGGYYAWEKGHILLWNEWGNPEDRPLWGQRDEFAQKYGQAYADWMLQVLPQPVPLPERLHHGPVRLADPALQPGRGGQDRGHHLLHRPQGRERRGPEGAHPPVRGLLQRQRHGHPGRPRGVPLLPEDLPGHRGALERHEPRRRRTGSRARTRTPRRSASNPVSSGVKTEDEGLFIVQHGYWKKALQQGLEIEAAKRPRTAGADGQARVSS